MQTRAPSITPRRRLLVPFRISVARLMVLIALFAVVLSAWLFNRRHSSIERAWVGIQIAALSHADTAKRAEAAENLRVVDRADLPLAMPALIGALADPDWQVRRIAAHSLAAAIDRYGAVRTGNFGPEIELATSALILLFDDSRPEVRIEAIRGVGLLHDTFRPVAPGTGPGFVQASIGAQGQRARKSLLRIIKDAAPELRAEAFGTLARLERLSGGNSALFKDYATHDPSLIVRIAAIRALVHDWPEDAESYPLLLARLKVATDPDEHAEIAWSFRRLVETARESARSLARGPGNRRRNPAGDNPDRAGQARRSGRSRAPGPGADCT